MDLELQHKIVKGEIDINNQQLFISTLFKALLNNLNQQITLRDKKIPHFVLNTGDDIMYLEKKGQDMSKEPKQVSNEDFIYNSVPRCILNMGDIEILEDQITSPYIRGNFDIEYKDAIHGYSAEFRRMPLKLTVSLKYYLDSFTDVMTVTQEIVSKMLFIRTFKFDYMGQTIQASYKVPTSYSHDKNITFDGGTTEQKLRTIELSLEVETNMPVYNERTAIELDKFIRKMEHNLSIGDIDKEVTVPVNERDKEIDYLIELIEEYRHKDIEINEILRRILCKINKKGFDEEFM